MKTLAELQTDKKARIVQLNTSGLARRRLMDLGILPGTEIEIYVKSPLGDPIAYAVRGAVIGLRNEQARQIMIELLDEETPKS